MFSLNNLYFCNILSYLNIFNYKSSQIWTKSKYIKNLKRNNNNNNNNNEKIRNLNFSELPESCNRIYMWTPHIKKLSMFSLNNLYFCNILSYLNIFNYKSREILTESKCIKNLKSNKIIIIIIIMKKYEI